MLFGLFGDKEKKNRQINEANKRKIEAILASALMSCRDAASVQMIHKIQEELSSQGETSEEKVIAIDTEILSLLNEANTMLLKQQYPTAIVKLNRAFNRAVDRHQYSIAGGAMTRHDRKIDQQAKKAAAKANAAIEHTRDENLQAKLDNANAELQAAEQEFELLREQNKKNPGNQAVISRASALKIKITGLKQTIDSLTVELQNEVVASTTENLVEENKRFAEGRKSESEREITRATLQAQLAERQELADSISKDMDILGTRAGVSLGDPFADGAADIFANPFGDETAAPAKANTSYGGFDASGIGSREMQMEISKTKAQMESALADIADKIDDLNDDFGDYNAELKGLLQRRKNASPADCLVLDGQIDALNSKRSGVIYQVKRYRQAQAELSDKLSMIDKLGTQNDIAAMNAKISSLTGGRFSDFEGLAMFLNDSVKQANESLEEIGVAASVAESEEIMMNSATGSSGALFDATAGKDEDKYAALEREVGLRA